MTTPDKFSPFEKTDIRPYVEQMDREVKALAAVTDFDIKPIGSEGFSISVDIQQYIDEAVTKLHNQVSSQVESNLNAILERAFRASTADQYDGFPEDQDEAWREFLRHLAEEAGVAVSIIEERNDG